MTFLVTLAIGVACAKAGTIGADNRRAINDYAASHDISPDAARKKFGASGRIMCPFTEASAFLFYKSNIVVTARHALYPKNAKAMYAGAMPITRCGFEVSDGTLVPVIGQEVGLPNGGCRDPVAHGDRLRRQMIRFELGHGLGQPHHHPIERIIPGLQALGGINKGRDIDFVPGRSFVLGDCHIRSVENTDGVTTGGLRADCSADVGSSGSPMLREGPEGIEAIGITTSGTGSCKKFDRTRCYTFGVGMETELPNRFIH
ncbi:hypothetical protein [Rhizobium rhizogenes]|uniref:hypothetical protein n=1 Tax=Rhizobium rhizogenes TaxID=359 RepID=UPI00157346B7|nr:hypothetical protein [Rhizobium rhizogenes]NTI78410.1 hypothetical protein [Rhizobium rhizogenes]